MSNALALAMVTATLQQILFEALSRAESDDGAPLGDPNISARAPATLELDESAPPRLNLFLYQVMPNIGWRNVDLPAHDDRGARATRPPLALDLYYLLTAYGRGDIETEALLGYGMQALHEQPCLERNMIRHLGSTSTLSDAWRVALSTSNLADQVEQVKITLQPLGIEELSKLWTAFQAQYRPSAAYLATVVLIERAAPARRALPVLRLGRTDQGVISQPDLLPPFPTLLTITPPAAQPAARLGETITLNGRRLAGDRVEVAFTHPRLEAPLRLTPLPDSTATLLRVALPDGPAAAAEWRAGFYTLAVVVREGTAEPRTTNLLSLTLAPQILSNHAERPMPDDVRVTITCQPWVQPGQRVSLVLDEREIPADTVVEATDTVTFNAGALASGDYFPRLRVDGVESLFINYGMTPLAFEPASVSVP